MVTKKDTVVLDYYDSLIRESDLKLLDGQNWLNDTIIGFYLDYLEKELYPNIDVCFVRPEVTQYLKLSPVCEYKALLEPLNFKNKSFGIMPLNDCESAISAGGSHWSLLVYSKPDFTFYHIDSSSSSNYHAAKILSSKLSQYLNISDSFEFKLLDSLQQSNSYDCGVFVLCNIDNLLTCIMENKKIANINLIKESSISKKRHQITSVIRELAKFKRN